MNDIGVKSIRVLRLSADRREAPAGAEVFTRKNSYAIVQVGEKNAEIRVEDRFDLSLDKEFCMEFTCHLKVIVGYDRPMKEEELKDQVERWVDQPVLSYANVVLGLVSQWMGLYPLTLPPVWSSKGGPTKGEVKKAGPEGRA